MALGLIPGLTDDDVPDDAVERTRLIGFAARRGAGPEAIARLMRDGEDIIGRFLELVTTEPGRAGHSLDEVSNLAGIEPELVQRLWIAAGLSDQPEAYDEDIAALRWMARTLELGLPAEALLQVVRVLADALGRVAEAETRLFHIYVHERLRADGLARADLVDATRSISQPLLDLADPTLLYFHRKARERAVREDMVLHLAEDVVTPASTAGLLPIAVVFVDLASFTPMTEAMGDIAAAHVVERFSDVVREATGQIGGRVIKQIGDEFMIVLPSADAAVRCGLDIASNLTRSPGGDPAENG
jgi:adenylate cyclase